MSQLFPDHFIGAAMLPQSPGVDPASCIPELDKRNTLGLNALRILDRQPWFRGGLLRRTR
ncbi:MAG: hypothetical protein BWZ02_02224 [Lentisphaerae bacterium ADurb.BinA184]|nr:MAG: hypothetical protein BWZ02_02224 [Lentisphaerae bacterium ADurb.BinA184]